MTDEAAALHGEVTALLQKLHCGKDIALTHQECCLLLEILERLFDIVQGRRKRPRKRSRKPGIRHMLIAMLCALYEEDGMPTEAAVVRVQEHFKKASRSLIFQVRRKHSGKTGKNPKDTDPEKRRALIATFEGGLVARFESRNFD
jgi:hypothetical protein